MTSLFGLDLAGRQVVIAGAGAVATRRVRRFLTAGAQVRIVAPDATDDLARQASHGDLEWVVRAIEPADIDDAWIVLAATDNPALNDEIAGWAHERRVWCIDASDASQGSARQAAMSTHGDVTIGVISTDAPDPMRIRGIRDAIAAHLDSGDVSLRRRRAHGGKVILVGSGPGDPGLVTVRGRQALAEADVVVTDRLGATELLITVGVDVEVINVGKSPDNHPVSQSQINGILVAKAREGKTVVRLKGGDPFVFGRGGEEVNACIAAGVDVEVVPGVTSAIAVPAIAGIPVTQRAVSNSVVITSGHAGADPAALAAITSGATAVFLMAVNALEDIVTSALAAGAEPATAVAIIESGSTARERVTRGELVSIVRIARETDVKPPAVIVMGEVAGPAFLASERAATS